MVKRPRKIGTCMTHVTLVMDSKPRRGAWGAIGIPAGPSTEGGGTKEGGGGGGRGEGENTPNLKNHLCVIA